MILSAFIALLATPVFSASMGSPLAPQVECQSSSTTINDANPNNALSCRLTAAPTAPVTLNLATRGLLLQSCALTFTASNWNSYQSIPVRALPRFTGPESSSYTMYFRASGGGDAYNNKDFSVCGTITRQQGSVCQITGDPHFKSLSGVSFSHQGVGTYYLLKTNKVHVQAIQNSINSRASVVHAVSVACGNTVAVLDARSASNAGGVNWNVPAGDASLFKLTKSGNIATAVMPDGTKISATVSFMGSQKAISISITLASGHSQVSGYCGLTSLPSLSTYATSQVVPDSESHFLGKYTNTEAANPWGQECAIPTGLSVDNQCKVVFSPPSSSASLSVSATASAVASSTVPPAGVTSSSSPNLQTSGSSGPVTTSGSQVSSSAIVPSSSVGAPASSATNGAGTTTNAPAASSSIPNAVSSSASGYIVPSSSASAPGVTSSVSPALSSSAAGPSATTGPSPQSTGPSGGPPASSSGAIPPASSSGAVPPASSDNAGSSTTAGTNPSSSSIVVPAGTTSAAYPTPPPETSNSPTTKTPDQEEIKKLCTNALNLPGCDNLELKPFFITSCVSDVLATGDYALIEGIKQGFASLCKVLKEYEMKDPSDQVSRNATDTYKQIGFGNDTTCSNSCSNNGQCLSNGCVCNAGFTGFDCSIKTGDLPKFTPILSAAPVSSSYSMITLTAFVVGISFFMNV